MSEKDRFEKERQKTLKELPDSIKQSFGQIGFYISQASDDDEEKKDVAVPVLIMNPFDVPPKPVRDIYWFDYFNRAKRAKKLSELAFLVYHYGANDPDDCYSFVEQEDFISFEDGKEMGYNILPEGLEEKENLTEREETLIRGFREMEQDLEKDPGERKRGNTEFLERHEEPAITKDPPAKRKKASWSYDDAGGTLI